MITRLSRALAMAAIAGCAFQPSIAQASECVSGTQFELPHWSVSAEIVTLAPSIVLPNPYQLGVSMFITTTNAGDGSAGCVGISMRRKGLPASAFASNGAPCSENTLFATRIFDHPGQFSGTLVGRLPLSVRRGTLSMPMPYDYRMIFSGARLQSLCFAAVGLDGTSAYWDGRN